MAHEKSKTPMISVRKLSMEFSPGDINVLDRISFSVSENETLSIIGPSGCGKTTLLYILSGLIKPTSGQIRIGNSRKKGKECRSSFILQNYGLFPWKTVFDNVTLGLKIKKKLDAKEKEKAIDLMETLNIFHLSHRYPMQLSGGQQQRVAIARALSTNPHILLMDEPFSSLDAITRERLQNILLAMWEKRPMIYIIVTHSVEEAVFLGRHILVLGQQPARVKKILENPGFGREGFRTDDAYFKTIRYLREIMETKQ